ncbi:MAG: cytochrome c oxidase assembly protein [Pseudomonadota bacterium]|nr:cytochrome c oxidase assembly protein [Pseudomonadota bacterium]
MTLQRIFAITGIVSLALLWLGPLPGLSRHSFAAHMAMHMGVVAVAAPLLAAGIADTTMDPARRWPHGWMAAPWWVLLASLLEFLLVWAWHAPALHALGRSNAWAMVLEQASFLGAGLLLWVAALGQGRVASRERAAAGALALLLTATHMTLLGVLLAMANRVLYQHAGHAGMAHALHDQQAGGVLMLVIGGVSYLAGALVLLQRVLRPRSEAHG